MQLNYFTTDTQAIKQAISVESPFNYYPQNNGKRYEAINQKGNVIWVIEFINDVMGWQISYLPNNLAVNNPIN